MRVIYRSIQGFANLNTQFNANKNRNAVRFQSQNLNWDYEVAEYHSKAFAKGLKGVGIGNNDSLLIRVPSSQQAQSYVAKVASSYVNAKLVLSNAKTVDELDKEISQNKVKAIIFEPTLPLEDNLLIDGLYELMPEAKSSIQGQELSTKRYSTLKMLIQTNFYTYPGVFKYRSIFNYANDKFSPFQASTSHEPVSIPESNRPLVITQPAHDFAFRAGILNSLINGRYVVCAQPNDVARIGRIYNNQIDLIATQDCSSADEMQVYVQKGSKILQGFGNRREI